MFTSNCGGKYAPLSYTSSCGAPTNVRKVKNFVQEIPRDRLEAVAHPGCDGTPKVTAHAIPLNRYNTYHFH